jgi:uncharacterized membrane protein YccC
LTPRQDLAYGGVIVFTLGAAGAAICAAIVKFAVLPGLATFQAFCAAIGLVLVPVGFATAWSRQPAVSTGFTVMGILFLPLLAATNPMTYDTEQFYNFALSALAGCTLAALSFLLLPSIPPTLRVRRLLALTLRDLRRLAIEDWERRIHGRLAALPDQAEPLQQVQLMAALSVGSEIIHLRRVMAELGVSSELDSALAALAQGDSAAATHGLPDSTAVLPRWRSLARRPPSRCACARESFSSATLSLSMARILTEEHPLEVLRDRPARRLRCAHLLADYRSVVCYDWVAPDRGPFRLAAPRLASGAFHIRPVHYCAIVNGARHRPLRFAMSDNFCIWSRALPRSQRAQVR